jgi:signal transduction histidine kinase
LARRILLFVLAAWSVVCPPTGGAAAEVAPIHLTAETENATLFGHLETFVDPTGELTFEEVRAKEREGAFEKHRADISGGYSSAAHWFRFRVQRDRDAPRDWILGMGLPFLNNLDVFVVSDGPVEHTRLGDHVPLAGRAVKSAGQAMALTLPGVDPVTVYARVSTNSLVIFHGDIRTPRNFLNREAARNLIFGIYYGVLGFVLFINFLFGAWLRDRAMLFYAAYVTSLLAMYLGLNGIAPLLLPTAPGWLLDGILGCGVVGGTTFSILMWDRFLSLDKTFPRVHRIYLVLAAISAPAMLTTATPYFSWFVSPVAYAGTGIGVLSLVLILILAWRKQASISHAYYFSAFVVAVVGIAIRMMALAGFLPLTDLTLNAYQASSPIHILLLSIGVVYRFRTLEAEKRDAERHAGLAEERARDQRRFLSFLSHEIRSPLAAIDKAAQVVQLENDRLSEPSQERLGRIRRRAGQLYEQVEQFLASEALEHGRFALNPEPVRIGSLLDGVRETLPQDLGRERVTCATSPREATWTVDRVLFETVVRNLVKNALAYSEPDRPVDVEARLAGETLRLTVRDQGRGMNAEDLAALGRLYFRGASSEGTKGTGLGFHLVRKIVDAHGGSLRVDSAKGTGTTVFIELPRL